MKIVVNNVVTKVISGGPDDLHYPGVFDDLRNYLSVDVPGAFFTIQYKKKVWDGKRYFLTPTGKMATGFLPFLLKHLIFRSDAPSEKRQWIHSFKLRTPVVPLVVTKD